MNNMLFTDWQAIEFAKEQDDEDLWDDLINYSLDKPGMSPFLYGSLSWASALRSSVRTYSHLLISSRAQDAKKYLYFYVLSQSR